MNLGAVRELYTNAVERLNDLRAELAEIEANDLRIRHDAYEQSSEPTVTGRIKEAEQAAFDSSLDLIDYRMRVRCEEEWVRYYQTLIPTLKE
jgi:cobalamin biosynthesis protein CbiD